MTSQQVVTLGETMGLLRATGVGSLEHVSGFELHIGGAESNVAIGLVRLGHPAVWIGRLGDDALGRRVHRELLAEQVDVRAVIDDSVPTGLMLKETPRAGATRVSYYRSGSAGSRLSPQDVDPDVIASAAILHVTGIPFAVSETAGRAVLAAVEIAQASGVPVSFDVNHRPRLWRGRDPVPQYIDIARRADIIFAGEDEAELLVGPAEPEALAQHLAALGPRQAIVKRGAAGSVASIDGAQFAEPAVAISVVDTVGAGDAFVAGYLAGLLEGRTPRERLELASRCGAFACLVPGDWEGAPRHAELAELGRIEPVVR